jgi:hypothetical protein
MLYELTFQINKNAIAHWKIKIDFFCKKEIKQVFIIKKLQNHISGYRNISRNQTFSLAQF